MFKINRRTDYAVRVGVALARCPAGTRLPTQTVQREMLIPGPFLQRIISELSHAHIIQTYPGPTGGIQLARPADEITLFDFIQAMEGPLCLSDCLERPQDCPLSRECPVRGRWGRLQRLLLRELQRIPLSRLAAELQPVAPASLNPQDHVVISHRAAD